MRDATYQALLAEIATTKDNPDAAWCEACGFVWNDSVSTSLTPAPSGRCPNEYNHKSE